jgi:two-component system CheB/CheR fusion protein
MPRTTGEDGPALKGLSVLIVDDMVDIREVFAMLFRTEGADVATAADGRRAIELVRQQDFDVLLTDLGLPDVPGDVLIRQILGAARRPLRVIVVTGLGEPFLSRAREAGAQAVLTKPLEWAEIVTHLTAVECQPAA